MGSRVSDFTTRPQTLTSDIPSICERIFLVFLDQLFSYQEKENENENKNTQISTNNFWTRFLINEKYLKGTLDSCLNYFFIVISHLKPGQAVILQQLALIHKVFC